MLKSLAELYTLLTAEQRRKLLRLQGLVILMAFAEIAGVVSIGPFMALVGDMSQLQGDGMVAELYRASGAGSPTRFLVWVGIGVLIALTLAAMISMFTIWRLSLYGARVGVELGNRLFRHYMHQPWIFHASGNSGHLINQITQECQRITVKVINPLMQMNAKLVMALFMLVAVFVYNPLVAVAGLLVFVSAYLLLYVTVRRRLIGNGRAISEAQTQRYRLMAEGFGGIKDVLVLGRQRIFTGRFGEASRRYADAEGVNQALSQVPRYAMELVAFGSVIFLVLYLLAAYQGNVGSILPVLSVYALAGFKLLPAFQQVYFSISQIRGDLAAFDALREDLLGSVRESGDDVIDPEAAGRWVPRQAVSLRDVVFRYPGKAEAALDGLTLEIPANRVVGLVGASGSGKSTTIDLLLGLIEPQSGALLIDGRSLDSGDRRAWQNALGFVPQSIFLTDATIRENIAFGLPPEAIDDLQVRRAASMAHLDDLLAELPHGLDTRVGERGVQLSGGQRQRIGIARALYSDAEVMVLDEATSALDGITEKRVMDAVHEFSGKKTTIIIAHRLATVRQCDCIYLIDRGRVIDAGRYEELLQRNEMFKRMAAHA
ncbi:MULTISPECIES: ABC transporter ATP-binding protein [unclassified Modicisalibacter]|uniref:ABC transporter ATP-binding protein n=1 Tax=unclassified Modicisalibacter TaxID=2679913 RepID=UPI001CCD090D|nr:MULTISPECIES: ABC transporter ATP-binding protein [unclassified Modicisalibacter]MBZ9560033.1 ABC transporter ATP-binding protein [Modicisalibacter sp. R2A 31.J]MBZ9575942.1 ABC transporter ATP-binding protein [Modicisalibacter sp. MOD 31.J]